MARASGTQTITRKLENQVNRRQRDRRRSGRKDWSCISSRPAGTGGSGFHMRGSDTPKTATNVAEIDGESGRTDVAAGKSPVSLGRTRCIFLVEASPQRLAQLTAS